MSLCALCVWANSRANARGSHQQDVEQHVAVAQRRQVLLRQFEHV
jgi:hypothetical protein